VDRTQEYVQAARTRLTAFNVFLRDRFSCQYCGRPFPSHALTFDDVVPRSKGRADVWANVVHRLPRSCNLLKGNRLPGQSGMYPRHRPLQPSSFMLQENAAPSTQIPARQLAQTYLLLGYELRSVVTGAAALMRR